MSRVRVRCLWAAVSVLPLALSLPANAALSPDQSRCHARMAQAARRYMMRSAAALVRCQNRVSRGSLPAVTHCRAEPATAASLSAAAGRLRTVVSRSCSDAVVDSLVFGAGCTGAATAPELAACVQASHDGQVDALLTTLYGTDGAVPPQVIGCQEQTANVVRRFTGRRLRLLQRCKRAAATGKIPPRVRCEEEPDTLVRTDAVAANAARKIAARCSAAALAVLDFGNPCSQSATGADLAQCLLAEASHTASDAALVQYGDGRFCGDAHQAVEASIAALLSQMTLHEKIEQMHGAGLGLGDTVWITADNERLGIPGFRMLDGPRGASRLAGNATAFPVGMARGATWDADLEERVGAAIAAEARAKGASVLLAPVTTVLRHPRWGRAQETYGEDPVHIGRMGVGFIRGAQQHLIASVKHYAVNSIEDTRFTVSVEIDERTLREIYLPHFRMAVQDAQVGSVMAAYNRIRGTYAAENVHLLRDLLKGEWGFQGFVESDWFAGTRSTVPSALAGLDIEMPVPVFYGDSLEDAVVAGDVPMETIDDAVRRILRTKFCFRLDDDPPVVDPGRIETEEHVDLALEVAQKAIVLLKNAGGALPLDRSALQSIAVVGSLANVANLGDTGSSDVTPSSAVTPLAGIQDRAGVVSVVDVSTDSLSPADQAAIAAADAAIVVVGLTAADEGESFVGAGDRDTLDLSPEHEALALEVAALNDVTIVVLEGSGAIIVESWIDDVEGLLMAWYPGQQGGNAIADVLFGNTNPSGKLPHTFPRSAADLPPFINDQDEVTYDYYHGYRLLDRDGIDPRYPFGFGLSYTTYAYSNLVVDDATLSPSGTLEVAVDVSNTGAIAGDEIVQLYVSYDGSSVDRPVRDLKDFRRVHLLPGETKTVSFSLPVEKLAFYDVDLGAWRVEPIDYAVHVGPSARDLSLSAPFEIMPPNILFVLADDLGYADLGIYGSTTIATPHLDNMARQGVMFTRFYTGNSVCSPARAAFLTGRYSLRAGFAGVFFPDATDGLDPSEFTIADMLRNEGYRTALIGKWHLGHLPEFQPNAQGFDTFYGTPYSNDMDAPVFPGEETPQNPCFLYAPSCRPLVPLMENGVILEMPAIQETLTQRYTSKAIEVMRQTVASDEPFFIYYASNFPHVPLYASEEFLGRSAGGLYGDVVEELDWSVGQLLGEIDNLGIADNTLVVFTSDNGPWLLWATDDAVPQGGLDGGSAAPLRHGKSTTFEGGMRVPLIARWPGRIPPGRTITEPGVMEDWMPTFAALAAAPLPADLRLDGKDITPVLTGTGARDPDADFRYLFVRSSNVEIGGYVEGKWKLKLAVVGGESLYARYDHDDLLFDLVADPGEANDLALAMPEKLAEMKLRMEDLAVQVGLAEFLPGP